VVKAAVVLITLLLQSDKFRARFARLTRLAGGAP
jgi:hypothetical protein